MNPRKPHLLVLASALGLAATRQQDSPATPALFDHAHAAWTEVLAEHVAGDRVDYALATLG